MDLDAVAPELALDRIATGWARYAAAIAIPPGARRLDFLIVGPPKTGTTWLYAQLVDEPDLSLPVQKESRYYSQNWRLFDYAAYGGLIDSNPDGLLGEASPDYFCLPDFALAQIAAQLPALKIIILLRQPTERLWSHLKHQQRYREGLFAGDAQADFLQAALHPLAQAHLDYAGGIARWRAHFSAAQIFIGFIEEIESDPIEFLGRVKAFLGATPPRPQDFDRLIERVNAGSPERPPPLLADALSLIARPHLAAMAHLAAVPANWTLELERKIDVAPLARAALTNLDASLFGADGSRWLSPAALFDHQALTEAPEWFSVRGALALVRYRGWLYGLARPERGPITRTDLDAANRSGTLKRAASLAAFELTA